ncbi:homoserine kinase [Brevibacillus fluminis]|uniref:Homoserine kinase n=1 Tax=Brevibacillus fluminis TaxID=511487 RepID=A0A3M8DRG3_9BACL|nr:homoserine kinase [Brevibacillus fluminis]RNB90736.1 homoserine kinase [Brevibacillus fluminis]
MNNMTVRVKVPASTANLGPGFDTLGMAFQLYSTITMRFAEKTEIRLIGEELQELPVDKTNLVYEVAAGLFAKANLPEPELYIEIETEAPLTRGLGSSASAIVGALAGANVLAGEPFTRDQLFEMASWLEGHPDNVGASVFGGFVVATLPKDESQPIPYVTFPVPKTLKTLVVIPDYWLATHKARGVLPEVYTKADVIYNVGHSSLLVAALAQGRLDLLGSAMQDRMHQPYRAPLVPGLAEMLAEATAHGALGAALSGAGPTTLFFYENEQQEQELRSFIAAVMARHELSYELMELLIDEQGVQIETV